MLTYLWTGVVWTRESSHVLRTEFVALSLRVYARVEDAGPQVILESEHVCVVYVIFSHSLISGLYVVFWIAFVVCGVSEVGYLREPVGNRSVRKALLGHFLFVHKHV